MCVSNKMTTTEIIFNVQYYFLHKSENDLVFKQIAKVDERKGAIAM